MTDELSHHQSPKHYQQIKMRNSYATRNNHMFGILGFLRREPSGRPGADRNLRFFSPKCYLLLEILSLQRVVRDADLFVESQSWKLSLAKQNAWTQRWVEIYDNYSPEFRKSNCSCWRFYEISWQMKSYRGFGTKVVTMT